MVGPWKGKEFWKSKKYFFKLWEFAELELGKNKPADQDEWEKQQQRYGYLC